MQLPDISDLVIPVRVKGSNLTQEMLDVIYELSDRGYDPKQISELTSVSVGSVKERLECRSDPSKWEEKVKAKDVNVLRHKIGDFLRNRGQAITIPFTWEELLKVRKTECHLTGRFVDINNKKSYELDHKTPVSRGGGSEVDNCYFACTEANQAKGAMLDEEFHSLVDDVFFHKAKKLTFMEKVKLAAKIFS